MSLRLVFTIIACGIALAHNVDGLQEQNAESPFGEDPISLLPEAAIYPDQHKSVHRRQSPEAIADGAVCETDDLTPVKVGDIFHDTGLLNANKRSLDVQSDDVAQPGCCG